MSINSIKDDFKDWYNCKYEGNTRGISAERFSDIETRRKSNLSDWEKHVIAAKDENKYEWIEESHSTGKDKGIDNAKNKTGYSGGKTGTVLRGVGDAVGGTAGALGNTVGKKVAEDLSKKVMGKAINKTAKEIGKKVGQKAYEKAAKEATEKAISEGLSKEAAEKVGEEAGKKAQKEAAKKAEENASGGKSWIITAPLSMSVGLMYKANKPNDEEHEAAKELYENLLPDAGDDLVDAQDKMDEATENVETETKKANDKNEESNKSIKEDKTLFDRHKKTYIEMQTRVMAGEELTGSQKILYENLPGQMEKLGGNIDETQKENGEEVNKNVDKISKEESNYNDAADIIGEVEGITDYAEGFDSATKTMCYVEAVGQGLNAASGVKAAYDAGRFAASGGIFTAWAWAFVPMGATGAIISGLGAKEQYEWAGDLDAEIDLREGIQGLGSEKYSNLNDNLDLYKGYNDMVNEDLEIQDFKKEDFTLPENTLNETLDGPAGTRTASSDQPDDKKKKEEQSA